MVSTKYTSQIVKSNRKWTIYMYDWLMSENLRILNPSTLFLSVIYTQITYSCYENCTEKVFMLFNLKVGVGYDFSAKDFWAIYS